MKTTCSGALGRRFQESFAKLLGTADKASIDRAVALYRERYGDIGLFENEVYPGIPEMLSTLATQGRRLFVATSKLHVYAAKIIGHFGLARHFERIFGAELDGTRSNKGDLLRYAISRSGTSPAHSVMIGDRMHDAGGAQAVGMHCLLVDWGYGTDDELRGAKSDGRCRAPAEVPPAVAKLFGVD